MMRPNRGRTIALATAFALVTICGCRDEPASQKSPDEVVVVTGSGSYVVDRNRLQNATFVKVGNRDLAWKFGESTVEISCQGRPISSEVVSDVLADDSTPLTIVGSWELVDSNQKLRLFAIEIDDVATDREVELPIRGAGEAHLDLGTQQYIIVSQPVTDIP